MHEPLASGSDPQAAIPVPEHLIGSEIPPYTWEQVFLGFSMNELSNTVARGDQRYSVVAFRQNLGGIVDPVWQRIIFRRTRSPSPQPSRRSHPEIASTILI
jgi:hypothetical protein